MSIRIDRERCVGCGGCADICPGNLPALDDAGKALIRRPADCWSCTACLKECPVGAISLALDPALGGGTERLRIRRTAAGYDWQFTGATGEERTLSTRADEANRY